MLDGKITTGFQARVPEWSADDAETAVEQAVQQLHGTPIAGVAAVQRLPTGSAVTADEFTTVEALCAGSASQACVTAGLRS